MDKTHRAKIQVINESDAPIHIQDIDAPGTEEFSLEFEKQHFNLNPGLTQDVYVHFRPKEYQYHYDYFVVHAEGQQLKVPIHGYPVSRNDYGR